MDMIDIEAKFCKSFHITLLDGNWNPGRPRLFKGTIERGAAFKAKRHFVGGHFYRRGAHFVEVVVGGCGALWSLFCPHDANLRAPECHFH